VEAVAVSILAHTLQEVCGFSQVLPRGGRMPRTGARV